MMESPSYADPFQSFYIAGFECATHRPRHGRRLDLTAVTGHDQHAAADYRRAQALGMFTARDGIRWHLIERRAGIYDFSSAFPMVRAARETGMQVIWDLCHFGWPDGLDIFSPAFVDRLAGLACAFAHLLRDETDSVPYITPVNEISYFAWACGDEGYMYPYGRGRGTELKRQLVRATIAATEAIWDVTPGARIVNTDPAIHVVPHPERPHQAASAHAYHEAQFESRDMLAGHRAPELGGQEKYLDILGVCYYFYNQWYYGGSVAKNEPLSRRDPRYRPLSRLLAETYNRYERPLFLAETSYEFDARPAWLRYVAGEVEAACAAGAPVHGLCWYPILDHPGWDDDRPCRHGLWGAADSTGRREVYEPLAAELKRQNTVSMIQGFATQEQKSPRCGGPEVATLRLELRTQRL